MSARGADRLVSGPSSATLAYDPLGRLYETATTGAATRFLYAGDQIVAEFNNLDALQRRYVPGPGINETVVRYEGSGTSQRRWLIGDERGSVISIADASGDAVTINTYDEHGAPGVGNEGLFQYTGQPWLDDVSLYHYRARAYSPTLGRFMHTDPIGFGGGMNLYAYVGDDPVNFVDPWGWTECPATLPEDVICIEGQRTCPISWSCYPLEELHGILIGLGRRAEEAWNDIERLPNDISSALDEATQCTNFRAGVLAGGALGFGAELKVGLQFSRATGEGSGFFDFDPATGDGGALMGFVEGEFGRQGSATVSPGFRQRASVRGGNGLGGGFTGSVNEHGVRSVGVAGGLAEGVYSSGGGGNVVQTPTLRLGRANPNCRQGSSQ